MPAELPFTGISVSAELAQVRLLADWLHDRCREHGLPESAAIDLELALVEAANNIVEHGGDGADRRIGLDLSFDGGAAVMSLTDSGIPVPPGLYDEYREGPLDADGGRGIGIVRACVDAVQYASAGGVNRLTLTRLLL